MIQYHPRLDGIQLNNYHSIDVLRLDLIDPIISGNKWFKLKQNLIKAQEQQHTSVLTFGGAHSNHLAATAQACKQLKLNCIGVIRGEKPDLLSPTLANLQQNGMILHFVSRENYTKKTEPAFIENLHKSYGNFYLVPEGGNNDEGLLGCMDILDPLWPYDYIVCACGTGTTFSGLVASANTNATVIGISVLKGNNRMPKEVETNLNTLFKTNRFTIGGNEQIQSPIINKHCIINHYAFSGYAKFDQSLIDFKKSFELEFNIPLDYVYTNKLFYALFDLIKNRKLKPQSKVLIIHSGGLQGNRAFEERFLT